MGGQLDCSDRRRAIEGFAEAKYVDRGFKEGRKGSLLMRSSLPEYAFFSRRNGDECNVICETQG